MSGREAETFLYKGTLPSFNGREAEVFLCSASGGLPFAYKVVMPLLEIAYLCTT